MQNIVFEPDKITLVGYKIVGFESEGMHIISSHLCPKRYAGDSRLWLLAPDESLPTYQILAAAYAVKRRRKQAVITFEGAYTVTKHFWRPSCDFFGNFAKIDIAGGADYQTAYARFYWDNLIPQIAERTFMRKKAWREGYVLSTLNQKAYGGTYPAVDHEFHIKGRLAVGCPAQVALVRRMLLLQLKIMREDKRGVSRNVCSVQPNGKREYDVWRSSMDGSVRAQMFRLTANIEFVEAVYQYYCATKDLAFVRDNMPAIVQNCAYIESFVDKNDLLQSHVHYEDQVMKDGGVLQAQCLAIYSFRLMARLAELVQDGQADRFLRLAERLSASAAKPLPDGFWDAENQRFVDWIDAGGRAHDHIHLLANRLPILFGVASPSQAQGCRAAIDAHAEVFDKFPSFVAAKIEDYTKSEIGTGGAYDLCAAGRYWCWDAQYLAAEGRGDLLQKQLNQVCAQAEIDGYLMGERYDMNYVYYNTGADGRRNWHGADLYYEYPNVFLKVLINDLLGIRRGFDCDLVLKPLFAEGSARLEIYGIQITVKDGTLSIQNIGNSPLTIRLGEAGECICLAEGGTHTAKLSDKNTKYPQKD